jgi:predicted lipoprotein with Yx(FWY)xxD motif
MSSSSLIPKRHFTGGFGRLRRRAVVATTIASMCLAGAGLAAGAATKTPSRTFDKATVNGYVGILTDGRHYSLYLLTSEKGGHLHCLKACLTTWPPLLVTTPSLFVSTAKGVKGKFALVKRSATAKQITYNGYPIYLFSGDHRAYRVNGQGISANGGTWVLINAGAKTSGVTPVKSSTSGAKSTTTTSKYVY